MTPISKRRDIAMLIGFILLSIIVSGAGGYVTAGSIPTWYADLNKPSFNPPNWIFGPVWTVLYLFIAIAGWRIWRSAPVSLFKFPMLVFFGQLILNFLWSYVFFGLENPAQALIVILSLLASIIACVVWFLRIDKLAGYLFIPYAVWVSFATLLNFAIWQLN